MKDEGERMKQILGVAAVQQPLLHPSSFRLHQPQCVSRSCSMTVANPTLMAPRKMGRWPDNTRSTATTFLLIFVLFPLLCLLAWWFVRG